MSHPDEEFVVVGRVGRPHGVQGAFVVERPSESPERFATGARLFAGRVPLRIVESKLAGRRRVIRLEQPVERGTELALPRTELPPPEEGGFYVFQLVGLLAVDEDGRELGHVQDVLPGVANDLIELDNGLLFPFVDDWVPEVDTESGRIVIRAGRLAD